MTAPTEWRATIRASRVDDAAAERLFRSLGPEAAREVPRARAQLRRDPGNVVEIAVLARDTGALRAALNTYLGWIALADRTETAATGAPSAGPRTKPL